MSLDLSYLNKMMGSDLNGKKAMLQVMQAEITKDLPRLSRLYRAQDWVGIARFCHHFKSTIVFSGNKQLIRANEQLWEIANADGAGAERAEQLIRTMTSQGQRVNREVAQVLVKLK